MFSFYLFKKSNCMSFKNSLQFIVILITIIGGSLVFKQIFKNYETSKIKSKKKILELEQKLDAILGRVDQLVSNVRNIQKYQKDYLNNLSNALIAEKVEQLTKDKKSEQEKCIVIAEWIASNISNLYNSCKNPHVIYGKRQGLCGSRSYLFVHMLSIIGIHAKTFHIFNHPTPNSGHVCAQAFYNNDWHFFDVTYAGYFKKNGHVISWNEICEESQQQNHMQYMVVFEKTCDLNQVPIPKQPIDSNVTFTNNHQRMREFYKDIHKSRESSGFYRENLKKILINFDSKKIESQPYILGDTSWQKFGLLRDRVAKLSLPVGMETIGNINDYLKHIWRFKNLVPNTKYTLSFSYYNDFPKGFRFFAKASDGATISQGKQVDLTKKVWKIVFTANEPNADIELFYERENNNLIGGLLLNQIRISKMVH